MRMKQNPTECPDRKPFLRCDLGDRGVFVFRVPSPGRAQALMRAYSEIDRDDMSQVEEACGNLIRDCWADGSWDLEGSGGAEVFAELWEAGWSFHLIMGLVSALVGEMNATFISEEEVSNRVAFFGRTPGRSTSSTSDSDTSETRGDSTP